MKNKEFSLQDMVKISHNGELSEPYIRYLCGLNDDHQYRHQEIIDVSTLIHNISVPEEKLSGFIYGYIVPQLNKEFDLLKITDSTCLDIELKCGTISIEKVTRQLIQNHHYLKLLNKPNLWIYTYLSSTDTLIKLDENNNPVECQIEELKNALTSLETDAVPVDLDSVFTPKNILVSPLNSPGRFLRGDYLLTENQENIKKKIISYVCENNTVRFVGLTGGPGTGKTLLVYDIAHEMEKTQKVLVVHSGILCEGHFELGSHSTMKIISAKELRLREIRDVDIVIVDEAHRLYKDTLDKVERWVKCAKTTCIFSYDAGQMLSHAEQNRNTAERIDTLCSGHIYKLTNKIRTNKELALFITCLRDLSKYRKDYSFPNARVMFEPNKQKAVSLAKTLKREGYTFISFTPSKYNHDLDYQVDMYNTHNVIGQEFDGVCMLIDDNFYYTENGHLEGKEHPNPDYLFEQLLYQGLSRVRSKIVLIITSETILQKVLPLMANS